MVLSSSTVHGLGLIADYTLGLLCGIFSFMPDRHGCNSVSMNAVVCGCCDCSVIAIQLAVDGNIRGSRWSSVRGCCHHCLPRRTLSATYARYTRYDITALS